MTTTCQAIVDRAGKMSTLNKGLTSDAGEMLSRIFADQQDVFTSVAGVTRDRFQTTKVITSSTAVAGRVFDLSALALPVERVLTLVLADGRPVSQVDVLDLEAELVPRYLVRGQTLVEVANDWNTTNGNAVPATLTYVYGPTLIDPTGQLTQLVSVPDQWIDLLVLPLAIYLHQKDPGRDEAESTRLSALLSARQTSFVAYLSSYGGLEVKRFDIPSPLTTPQKK